MRTITARILTIGLIAAAAVCSGSEPPAAARGALDPAAQAVAVGVLTQTAALKLLRTGDTAGAISVLEAALDSNLMILSEIPNARNEPGITSIVRNTADYRAKYPRKSRPELDALVSKYLNEYHGEAK